MTVLKTQVESNPGQSQQTLITQPANHSSKNDRAAAIKRGKTHRFTPQIGFWFLFGLVEKKKYDWFIQKKVKPNKHELNFKQSI